MIGLPNLAEQATPRDEVGDYPDERDTAKVAGRQWNLVKQRPFFGLMVGSVARIEAIARRTFGLPFLKELVKRGELHYEKSMSYYLTETRESIKQGLAKKIKKEVTRRGKTRKEDYLKYEFEYMLQMVIDSMGIREPDYVDEARLKKQFLQMVNKASKNSLLERIVLGQPFLEF